MASAVLRTESVLPDIDERLVVPETRYEMHDGELVHVAPPIHATPSTTSSSPR